MKKIILLIALIGFIFTAKAQIEFNFMGGYFLGGRVDFYEGTLNMQDNAVYNFTASVPTVKSNNIELSYSVTFSDAIFNPNSFGGFNYERVDAKLITHYILIGSYQNFKTGGPVTPFIGLSIGTVIYDYQYSNVSNVWRFAGSLGGGVKIDVSEKVGLRLQGRLLMPMYFAGAGFYTGIGSGGFSSGLSLNAGVLAIEGDFSAGLILKLK